MFIRIGRHVINLNSVHHVVLEDPHGGVTLAMAGCMGKTVSGMHGDAIRHAAPAQSISFGGAEAEALRRVFNGEEPGRGHCYPDQPTILDYTLPRPEAIGVDANGAPVFAED